MDVRTAYEKSWQEQRGREARNRNSGSLSRLRDRLSQSRYEVARRYALEAVNAGQRAALADIGCGRGEILQNLGPLFIRSVGLDVAATELGRLAAGWPEELRSRMELKSADLNDTWPLESASFDLITCLAVLEHLFDPYFVASELARICKPGAHLILEVPNIAFIGYRLSLLRGSFPSTSGDDVLWDGGHLHYFTIHDLRKLFTGAGFQIIGVSTCGFLSKIRSLWPVALGRDLVILLRRNDDTAGPARA